jgi:hypothetical protein
MYLHELKLWNFRKYGITGENTFEILIAQGVFGKTHAMVPANKRTFARPHGYFIPPLHEQHFPRIEIGQKVGFRPVVADVIVLREETVEHVRIIQCRRF